MPHIGSVFVKIKIEGNDTENPCIFMKMIRNICLAIFLTLTSVAGLAQVTAQTPITKNNVEIAVEALRNDPELKNSAITFYCYDITAKKVVAEYNPDMSVVPASVMKLVTTASALEILGAGYKFKTVLQYTGTIDSNKVLHGDLIIKGGGDPTLGSKYFNSDDPSLFLQEWTTFIRNAGIDSITGRVIADPGIYSDEMVPATWAWGDIGNGYGAAPSGLSIYDNICILTFKTGGKAGDSAVIDCIRPYVPDMEFINEVSAGNTTRDESYIFGAPYSNMRLIRGVLPKGQAEYEVKGSLPDPAFLAAFELTYALKQAGIGVGGSATTVRMLQFTGIYPDTKRTEIYAHQSPALASIVYFTNLNSVNLFAEHLINQIGYVRTGSGTVTAGSGSVVDFWTKKGLNTTGMYVTDGSGLSRFDALSGRHLVDILVYMNESKNYSTFEKSLPVAGKSGTLSHLCKGTKAQGNVMAKSGTMTRVKSFAGYVKAKSGNKLAFAVILNNFNCTTKLAEKKLEKILISLAEY
jgi:serine-type D-Ala-D-Ala carboxypeptidase/endopeptidase (penicillin-binding protein 4)